MPERVLMSHDIHGLCVAGDRYPHFVIKNRANAPKCVFKVEKQQRVVVEGTNKFYCTDFEVKNVTATCEYLCAFSTSKLTKTVVVTGLYSLIIITFTIVNALQMP